MLTKDVLKEYLFHLDFKNYSVRTQKNYRTHLKAFFTYLEKEFEIDELEDIRPTHIKQYGMYLNKKGRKAVYINGIFKSVRSFFNYCVDEGYLTAKLSPTAKVQWLKEDKTVIKAFTAKEVKDMVNAFSANTFMEARNKLIIMTLADTGIRNLELCQLMKSNIGTNTIKIIGKGNKERYIAISPALNKYLIKYDRLREHYIKNDFNGYDNLFLSFTGKPLTVEAVERVVKVAGERAGIKRDIRISPHTLRHTYAQMMVMNGLDVYSLSRLLGHENINITKRYLQSLEDEQIVENSIKSSPLMNI